MSENNGLLDRIARAEGVQNEIIESLQAISQVVGPGEVQARLGAIKRDKMAQLVDGAVKDGKLEAVEEITAESFVVGQQLGRDGAPLFPGRFQVFVPETVEDVRKAIVGKKVGDSVPLSDGGSVKIDEVYVRVTESTPPKAKKAKKVAAKPKTPPLPAPVAN